MRLNPQALERLNSAKLTASGLVGIFEHMASIHETTQDPTCLSLRLDYQAEGDTVAEGDLIPVISISLRPATQS